MEKSTPDELERFRQVRERAEMVFGELRISKTEKMLIKARMLGPGQSMVIACATEADAKRVAALLAKEMIPGVRAVGPDEPFLGSSKNLTKILDDALRHMPEP